MFASLLPQSWEPSTTGGFGHGNAPYRHPQAEALAPLGQQYLAASVPTLVET